MTVTIKTAEQIPKARLAGHLAAQVLHWITPHVKAGVTTDYLDQLCYHYIVNELKVIPANIGYHGYQKTACISVNHVVCHGIPDHYVLQDGDMLNIDIAIINDGWYGDTSRMYFIGTPNPVAKHLSDTCLEAMLSAIDIVRPGTTLGDIGHTIETIAHREGLSVVEEYCGHGIGQIYHEAPQVLHFGQPKRGLRLQEGMIFTIEPMINAGKKHTSTLKDGWTVITQDKSLSAQWEHMVLVTCDGYEVLTPWP